MGAKLKSDNSNVYLFIEDLKECCFELWNVGDNRKSCVKVTIPLKSWKTMLKQWTERQELKK